MASERTQGALDALKEAGFPLANVVEAPQAKTDTESAFNAANIAFTKNAKFKKVFEPWKQFRSEQVLWFRVVENTFDNFMARQSAANKL